MSVLKFQAIYWLLPSMPKFVVVASAVLFNTQALALYKCTDSNGKISFQDVPCTRARGEANQKNQIQGNGDDAKRKDYVNYSREELERCDKLYKQTRESKACIDVVNSERYTINSAGLVETYYKNKKNILAACEPTPACGNGHYEVHSMDLWAGTPTSPGSYDLETIAGRKCRYIGYKPKWQKCEGFK